MTERGARHVERSASSLRIGPSRVAWAADGALEIDIDERCAPLPQRVFGRVRLVPEGVHTVRHPLDAAGRHEWQPIAPCARVEVDLLAPRSRWSGSGYLDHNRGTVPLERDFRRWHWSRARTGDGGTAILYDVERRDGSELGLALAYSAESASRDPASFAPPPTVALPRSGWRVARSTRSDGAAGVERALEDGPFYARSLVTTTLFGAPAVAVHESLDLDRFASPWVQAMLPFRMPRRG